MDPAKRVFLVREVDVAGHVLRRQELKREAFPAWHGRQPGVIATQFIGPFRKRRTTKNDRNDAEAIATVARQGNMRFVPVKSVEQQTLLAWHRVREGYKGEHLTLGNRLRGLLAEFGVVVTNSDVALHRILADLDAYDTLSGELRGLLHDLASHWAQLRARIDACDTRIAAHARQDARCARLRSIVGTWPITADAVVATLGAATDFRNPATGSSPF